LARGDGLQACAIGIAALFSVPMIPLSVLDVVPVRRGSTPAEALQETLGLAKHVEQLGYHRYWFAEHHGFGGIASSVPAILAGQVAAITKTMRVGSGGVMLPNHAPLVVAEQFGTLEALFPGRIDLGIGRAPGTDGKTARALRRSHDLSADDFPQQLAEILGYFRGQLDVKASPSVANEPPVWLLGSSDFSAQVAGLLSLPFSFAHHFSGQNTLPALKLYRDRFKPSKALPEPHAMVAVIAIVADTDAEAMRLALPNALAFLRIRQGGAGPYPTVEEAEAYKWSDVERAFADDWMSRNLVGSPTSVKRQLDGLLDATKADELMVLCTAPVAEARLRTYTLLRELVGPSQKPRHVA
jgi:luciferase family oxidoreductase group 1